MSLTDGPVSRLINIPENTWQSSWPALTLWLRLFACDFPTDTQTQTHTPLSWARLVVALRGHRPKTKALFDQHLFLHRIQELQFTKQKSNQGTEAWIPASYRSRPWVRAWCWIHRLPIRERLSNLTWRDGRKEPRREPMRKRNIWRSQD